MLLEIQRRAEFQQGIGDRIASGIFSAVFAQGRLTVWIHWNMDRLDLLVGDSF